MEEEDGRAQYTPVCDVPTHVLKFGRIEHNRGQVLILIIPGNPGIIGYYQRFMEVLYRCGDERVPVWGLSHAGHVTTPNTGQYLESDFYTLEGQIKHKLSFVEENVPGDVKLVLVGHSIGCYIILKMLEKLDSHRVLRCFLLFPTIERMAASPKGQVSVPLLKYFRWLSILLSYLASYFSPHVQYRMILWYFQGRPVAECAYNASMNLFDPFCVRNIMNMANEEMKEVTELNTKLVSDYMSKLSFYYGLEDSWCPRDYYHGMKEQFPHADIQLCEKGLEHAFVLEGNDDMAGIVWSWLQKDLHKVTD
ncbi:hypothetical protein ScPMuIL_005993 [Solemya velum]